MDKNLIATLEQTIEGEVSQPNEALYTKASHMFVAEIHPLAVIRPKNANDVAATVLFAQKHELSLAIRSGGHNNIARRIPEGGLLLDMSGISSIEVLDDNLVRVGSGALWHEVASELGKHNLAISSGDTRTVGVGGLTTGGGIGWVVRRFGLAIDQLMAAEVVTANGQILTASTTENPDLFWAIRGGGSNFGVITHFEFAAHRLEGIFAGTITYPMKDVAKVVKGWRDAMREAPLELTTMLLIMPSFNPNAPAAITITACYAGTDETEAKAAFAPLLALGEISKQTIERKPYGDILEDAHPPAGMRVIVHNTFFKELSDECITAIEELCNKQPPLLQLRYIAGTIGNTPNGETAFSHRHNEVLIVNATFIAPAMTESETDAALTPWRRLEPFGHGMYLNLASEDTGTETAEAFPPETLAKLQRIKAKYDPSNFFTNNYNISPKKD